MSFARHDAFFLLSGRALKIKFGHYTSKNNPRTARNRYYENLIGGGGSGALGFGDLGWRRGLGFHVGALLALGKIDAKGGAPAFLTGDGNGAVMIADNGLDDGQAKAGTLMLSGVVGREKAGAFFGSETSAGVGYFDADGVVAIGSAQGEAAAGRHGI